MFRSGGDQYIHLARHLAHGSLNVDDLSSRYRDYAVWDGHKYLAFGPFAAVILVPFLWLLNHGVLLVVFGCALTVFSILLFHRVLTRIGVMGERQLFWWHCLFVGHAPWHFHLVRAHRRNRSSVVGNPGNAWKKTNDPGWFGYRPGSGFQNDCGGLLLRVGELRNRDCGKDADDDDDDQKLDKGGALLGAA